MVIDDKKMADLFPCGDLDFHVNLGFQYRECCIAPYDERTANRDADDSVGGAGLSGNRIRSAVEFWQTFGY